MYKNVVSTQDLLSDSQRTNYSSDSALFSLSQRQHSGTGSEFSQVRTQDLFTQNQAGAGSQSENSFPTTRKMNMYDKWMSKGAVFKKDQPGNKPGGRSQLQLQQQFQLNQNKGKESDDRELLQQVVNIVQDCNKEVKYTLTAVKDKLESHSELTGEKLCDTMKAFLEDIWKHEDKMLQAVQERCQSQDKIHELENQLALTTSKSKERLHELEKVLVVKDAELKQLHSQLEEKGKPGDLKQMAKAVRQEMLSPQLAVENKLMEILEVTREASEQQSHQLNQYKDTMTAHAKQYNEWKTFNQRLIKDMEKRLQKDIASVGKDLQKQEQDWMSSLQDQLAETSAACSQDMEKLFEKALTESAGNSSRQGGGGTAAVTTIVASMKKDLQSAIQRQSKTTEKNIQDMLGSQLQKQQQQLNSLHKTLMADVTTEIESAAERRLQDKDGDEDPVTPRTVPVFEEYHADLKHQLEEMHKKHVEEVKRIQKEMKLQESSTSVPSAACKPFSASLPPTLSSQTFTSATSYAPKTTGYQLQRRKDTALISPMSDLDRSTLFTRAKPSPVVAVLPQPHPTNTSSLTSVKSGLSETDPEVIFGPPPAEEPLPEEPCCKAKQAKKRKTSASGFGKKKRSAKKAKNKRNVETVNSPPCQVSVVQTAKKPVSTRREERMMIYDFSQEKSPQRNWWHFEGLQVQRRRQEQSNQFYSPNASTASCRSSPAVSVTVDSELVVVRRSRWQTTSSSTPNRVRQPLGNDPLDMLSTPCMESTLSQRSFQHSQMELIETQPRRSQRKRIL
ncbi:kinectin-like [Littorina saxatilis]|uniref:Uncharacterized protein n=1 Tax=Littorina saxatilis TaxID=31220 RepID=A0AAN9GCA8_9CAEN